MTRRTFLTLVLAAGPVRRARIASTGVVRVGALGLFHPRTLIVRPGDAAGLSLLAAAETIVIRDSDHATVSLSGLSVLVTCAGRSITASSVRLAAPDAGNASVELSVPGRIVRRFNGLVAIVPSGPELVPVVSMSIETAVASVVAAELPTTMPLEALKAQAVAARSYFLAARRGHGDFEFCDTTHCQFLRDPPSAGSPADAAARATSGLVLVYREQPIAALYSGSCGGRTRTLSEAGLSNDGSYPYFSVDCAYCVEHAREWERSIPADSSAELLEARSEQGRIIAGRLNGWSSVPSNNFEIERAGHALVLRGRGAGHGIGLCQSGSAAMAAAGASFREILKYYYPNTTLASY